MRITFLGQITSNSGDSDQEPNLNSSVRIVNNGFSVKTNKKSENYRSYLKAPINTRLCWERLVPNEASISERKSLTKLLYTVELVPQNSLVLQIALLIPEKKEHRKETVGNWIFVQLQQKRKVIQMNSWLRFLFFTSLLIELVKVLAAILTAK